MVHGPCTNGVEVVDNPPMDILSKSITDPSGDPGGGGGIGSGAPPATNTGAGTGAAGFAIGWAMGAGAFTTVSLYLWYDSLHCWQDLC